MNKNRLFVSLVFYNLYRFIFILLSGSIYFLI